MAEENHRNLPKKTMATLFPGIYPNIRHTNAITTNANIAATTSNNSSTHAFTSTSTTTELQYQLNIEMKQ